MLTNLCYVWAFFAVLLALPNVWKLIKRKTTFQELKKQAENNPKYFNLSVGLINILVAIILILDNPSFSQLIRIHDIEKMPEGTYCFYVELNSNGKTYVVPASVIKEHNDNSEIYSLRKVVFTNGDQIHFDSERIHINSQTRINSTQGDAYYCTLLNQHAYSPYITETNDINVWDLLFLVFVEGCCLFFASIFLFRPKKN